MRKLLQSLTPGAEFLIVITVAFGPFIVESLFAALHPVAEPHHSAESLDYLVVYELALLGALGAFLYFRGWSFKRLGFAPTLLDTAIGLGLGLFVILSYAFLWSALATTMPQLAAAASHTQVVAPGVPLLTAASVVLVNPVFEEVFVAGYTMTVLKDTRGESFAFNASVTIRLLYHLYQGVVGVITVIPLGLILAFWYARTGKLWPLIVAHAALDAVGLIQLVKI
jgi:membrane protease YdiL (CAAX protease family)